MAKKVLTPEQQEIKAMKKAKKSQNWTKFWAIVLALALTLCIAFVGKSQGEKNAPKADAATGTGTGTGSDAGSSDGGSGDVDFGFDTDSDSGSGDTDTPTDPANPATPGADNGDSTDNKGGDSGDKSDAPAADNTPKSEADVAALINKATGEAVAQKVGYDWSRDCTVKDIDVGFLTSFLNNIVSNATKGKDDVNSIVGKFLGAGSKKETVKKGQTLDTMQVAKDDGSTEEVYHGSSYTLKATSLKAEDIKNLKISGNTYTFNLPNCTNPDRNGNNALARFTNDVVIQSEVNKEIQDNVGSAVSITSIEANYSNIKVQVTIKDGKLVNLGYSFYADAKIGVKVAIGSITGTGNLTTKATYTNFQY